MFNISKLADNISDLLMFIVLTLISIKIFYYANVLKNRHLLNPLYRLFAGFLIICGLCYLLGGLQFWYKLQFAVLFFKVVLILCGGYLLFYLSHFIPVTFKYKTVSALNKEIDDRLNLEGHLIAKNRQLEWAEKTAKICYGSINLLRNTIIFSDGAKNVLGIDSGIELSIKEMMAIIVRKDRHDVAQIIKEVKNNKVFTPFTFRIKGDGLWKYINVKGEIYYDETATTLCLRGTFQDITEQKQYVKKIEESSKILREIAWIQSHDVRGPLTTVLGLCNLLEFRAIADDETLMIVNGIKESASKLDDVIKSIVTKSNYTSN